MVYLKNLYMEQTLGTISGVTGYLGALLLGWVTYEGIVETVVYVLIATLLGVTGGWLLKKLFKWIDR